MLLDARAIPEGGRLDADVCIVGAGPAGIAVALELDGGGANVLVLAGDETGPDGEVVGEPYPPLSETRAGGIGGTAALWHAELAHGVYGARYAPLGSIDFEQRDGVPGSGWPFGRDALDPFYERASELCDAGSYDDYATPPTERSFVDPDLVDGLFHFGAAEPFMRTYPDRLRLSETVRLVRNATATRLHTVADGTRVDELEAQSMPGRSFRVGARTFVLAAGGLENPRLLLLSEIGNEFVGRCFMDHPTIRCRLELEGRPNANFSLFDARVVAERLVLGRLDLSGNALRRERLLNGGFFFVPARDREARAVTAARGLVDNVRAREIPEQPLRRAVDVLAGADALAFAAHRKLTAAVPSLRPTLRMWRRAALLNTLGTGGISGWSELRSRPPRVYDVHHVIEQRPDPDRRVTLGQRHDRFGLPLPRLHWSIGAAELASAERAEDIVKGALLRLRVGRLTSGRELAPQRDLLAAVHPSVHHHLGTTRMHNAPKRGVVDAEARVHGVSNLFVAGGSVFPTSGFVNPTLTIVALALRLGSNLRENVLR